MGAIEVENLGVFRDGAWALEGVSFSLEIGEFLGVTGPNGGGKSTLIKTIAGLLAPDRGSVKIFGKTPAESGALIGYAPQETATNLSFPIRAIDVVKMGFLARKSRSKADEDEAFSALEKLGAATLAKRRIGTLSGGERQRVFIARALVGGVKILLLDEPTTGIDEAGDDLIAEVFKAIKSELAIVCVGHDKARLKKIADRVVTIRKKLIED